MRTSSALRALTAWFERQERVVVLLSGGVDSGVLAVAGTRALGERVVAVTGRSASLAADERDAIARLVREHSIVHIEVATHEGEDPAYVRNDRMRCYVCKTHLFRAAEPVAKEQGAVMVTGAHVDDLGDWRPGMLAAEEAGVRSPLLELGVNKATVRDLARELGVDWLADKPAAACLASRIPTGTPVTPRRLSQVERFEAALHRLGILDVRVRHHGDTARIQVPRALAAAVLEHAEQLTELGSRLGFTYTTLDLADLRGREHSVGPAGSEEAAGWRDSRRSSGTRAS